MEEILVPYTDGDTYLEGFAAYPRLTTEMANTRGKYPLVILCHAWKGRDDFICEKAKLLASWGYIGCALDMYGKGILGKSKEEENARLKHPFLENRKLLQQRILKGFEMAKQLPRVEIQDIAVLGFGFGGICALDLARTGANLRGAIIVYGHFGSPPHLSNQEIRAKILILHGYDDPVTPQNELLAFEQELNAAKIDWQAHVYGGTMHAFATPGANDPASGILYQPTAERRAWQAIRLFLNEIFAKS